MSEINFDNVTKSQAISYAKHLSNALIDLPEEDIEHILWKPYCFETFNPEEINRRLKLLTP